MSLKDDFDSFGEITISCVILVLGLLVCNLAYAEGKASVWFGWQHTVSSQYGESYVAGGRSEAMVYEGLSLAIEYEYHGPTAHEFKADNPGSYGDLSGHAVLGEIIYYPRIKIKSIQPYLFGGLGWSWWEFEREASLAEADIQVKLGDSFAKKVGVGIEWPLGNGWLLGMEWSYFHSYVPKDSFYEADGSYANVLGDDASHGGRIKVGQEETNLVAVIKRTF